MQLFESQSTGEVFIELADGSVVPYDTQGLRTWINENRGVNPQQESAGTALMAGAGRFFDDTLRNVSGALGRPRPRPADEQEAYNALREQHPAATLIGETVPGFAIPGFGAKNALGRFAVNAATNALTGDADYSLGQRAAMGVIGGEIGNMAGRLMGRFGNIIRDNNMVEDTLQSRMTRQFEDAGEGLVMTPAERGGRAFQNIEAGFEALPFTDNFYQRLGNKREAKLLEKVSRTLDIPPGNSLVVDDVYLDGALDVMEDRFSALYSAAGDTKIELDTDTVDALLDVMDRNTQQYLERVEGLNLMPGGMNARGIEVNPTIAGRIRTGLTNQIANAGDDANAIANIGDAMDRLQRDMEGHLGGDWMKMFRDMLDQYEVVATLNGAYQRAEGGIPWATLNRQLQRKGKTNRMTGHRNKLFDDLKQYVEPLASSVNRVPFNTSGTARANALRELISSPIGLLGYFPARAYYSEGAQEFIRQMQDAAPASAGLLEAATRTGRELLDEDEETKDALLEFLGMKDD